MEQTRAARKAGPNRAAFGRAANAQLSNYSTRTAAPQLPAQPRTARATSTATTSRLFWPSYGTSSYSTTRATTRRKAAQNKSESRKDKRGYLFRLPGQLDFWPIRTQGIHGENRIIFTNRDTRKYIEIHRNSLEIFRYRQLNTTRVFFWLSAIWDSGLLRILAIYSSIYHLHITLSFFGS